MQEPGEIEAEMAQVGASAVLKKIFTTRKPGPPFLPKGKAFRADPDASVTLPSWLSEEDLNYYATKFKLKGFTGGLNYYRNLDLCVTINCNLVMNQTLASWETYEIGIFFCFLRDLFVAETGS